MSGEDAFASVQFDAVAAGKASNGLDVLADRLAADLQAAEEALRIQPAGADEVSARAAQTGNEVATSYLASAQASVHEMRKLAATLRMHTNEFAQIESDSVADFDAAGGRAV
ncbi:PE domain-containing protein [Nocardia brasiliensis]|uniref:PE domain-containing protein n=1 Tax=Nocardia brasiliensis TaxID=37326 RepID=A0A6G9XLA0_NOCBR|nr:PE domain-containing protein [Nocardia brasiliensis]QIS01711.1 PE domain-containing protein [Nocardia brasiliensis]